MIGAGAAALAAALWMLGAPAASAEVAVGTRIPAAELPSVAGGRRPILASGKVNVLVFFRPGQAHSAKGLAQVARVHRDLASRPVAWTAIASDRFSAAEVEAAARAAGFKGAALLDEGDAVYGTLEVRLHPVVLVVARDGTVAAYQPVTQIDFEPIVRARVRRALGEIGEEQLQKALSPPAAVQGGETANAERYTKLAEQLLRAGDLDRALESARKGLEHDPSLARAHAVLGAILAAQNNCPEAVRSFRAALALDAKATGAAEGLKRCAGN